MDKTGLPGSQKAAKCHDLRGLPGGFGDYGLGGRADVPLGVHSNLLLVRPIEEDQ